MGGRCCRKCKKLTLHERKWFYKIPFYERRENWNGDLLGTVVGKCENFKETAIRVLQILNANRKPALQLFIIVDVFFRYKIEKSEGISIRSSYIQDVFHRLNHPNNYFKKVLKYAIDCGHPCGCCIHGEWKIDFRVRVYSRSRLPSVQELSYRLLHHIPRFEEFRNAVRPEGFWENVKDEFMYFRIRPELPAKLQRALRAMESDDDDSDSDTDVSKLDEYPPRKSTVDYESDEFSDPEEEKYFEKVINEKCEICSHSEK